MNVTSGLANFILDMLKSENFELELEVDSVNEKAYNLYKKAGFREARIVNYHEKILALED